MSQQQKQQQQKKSPQKENPNYPSKTGNPSGPNRGNEPKKNK